MKASLTKKLCCPLDKHDLDINIFTETENGDILEALMTCSHCNRYFPVIYGIPILIPDEYRDKALEGPLLKKWGYSLKGDNSEQFLLEE